MSLDLFKRLQRNFDFKETDVLSRQLRQSTKSITESYEASYGNIEQPDSLAGFYSRPRVEDYSNLFSQGRSDSFFFQFQNMNLTALTSERFKESTVITQVPLASDEDKTKLSILGPNRLATLTNDRIKGISSRGSLHPKIGVIQRGGGQGALAFIGTQNITPALERNSTMESLLVLDEDMSSVEKQGVTEITDFMNAANKALKNARATADRLVRPAEVIDEYRRMRRGDKSPLLFTGSEIREQFLSVLEQAKESGTDKVVLSMGRIDAILSGAGGSLQNIKDRIEDLSREKRLTIITDERHLGSILEDRRKKSFVAELIKNQSITIAPTGFHHDKMLAVFDQQYTKLHALLLGSANLSQAALGPTRENEGISKEEIGSFYNLTGSDLEDTLKEPLNLETVMVIRRDKEDRKSFLDRIYANVHAHVDALGLAKSRSGLNIERRSDPDSLSQLRRDLEEIEQITVSGRYAPRDRGEDIVGLNVDLQHSSFNFTTRRNLDGSIDVWLSDYNKLLSGSVIVNQTTREQTITGTDISLRPGQAARLSGIQTASALVRTLAEATSFRGDIPIINKVFKEAAISDSARLKEATRNFGISALKRAGGSVLTAYEQVSLSPSTNIKLPQATARMEGLRPVFAKLEQGLGEFTKEIIPTLLEDSDNLYGDIKRSILEQNKHLGAKYRRTRSARNKKLLRQVLEPYAAVHELGYLAFQSRSKLPVYSLKENSNLILDPHRSQFGSTIGEAGEYLRLINSATQPALAEDSILSQGAGIAFHTESIFTSTSGLSLITAQQVREAVKRISSSVDENTLEEILRTELRRPLLSMPFTKLEQVPQRFKSLLGQRAGVELDPKRMKRVFTEEGFNVASAVTDTLRRSLPTQQYEIVKQYIEQNKNVTWESINEYFREQAIDPFTTQHGFLGRMKRVALTPFFSLAGDFSWNNPAYEQQLGKIGTTRKKIKLENLESTVDTIRALKDAFKKGNFVTSQAFNGMQPGLYGWDDSGKLKSYGTFTSKGLIEIPGIFQREVTETGVYRTPITIQLPTFTDRERGALTIFTSDSSITAQRGSLKMDLQYTTGVISVSGNRAAGGGLAKGPALYTATDEIFEQIKLVLENRGGDHLSLYPQEFRKMPIYSVGSPALFKGYNVESGLALLSNKEFSQNIKDTEIARSLALLTLGDTDVKTALVENLRVAKMHTTARSVEITKGGYSITQKSPRHGAVFLGLASLLSDEKAADALSNLNIEPVKDVIIGALGDKQQASVLAGKVKQLFSSVRDESIEIDGRIITNEGDPLTRSAGLLAHAIFYNRQLFVNKLNSVGSLFDRKLNDYDLYMKDTGYKTFVDMVASHANVKLGEGEGLKQQMDFLQSLLESDHVVENLADVTMGSHSVAAGKSDSVKLEFQNLHGMALQRLQAYKKIGGASAASVNVQQTFMMVMGALSSPSSTSKVKGVGYNLGFFGSEDEGSLLLDSNELLLRQGATFFKQNQKDLSGGFSNLIQSYGENPETLRETYNTLYETYIGSDNETIDPSVSYIEGLLLAEQKLKGKALTSIQRTKQIILPSFDFLEAGDDSGQYKVQFRNNETTDPIVGVMLGTDILANTALTFGDYKDEIITAQHELVNTLASNKEILQKLWEQDNILLNIDEKHKLEELADTFRRSQTSMEKLLGTELVQRAFGNQVNYQGGVGIATNLFSLGSNIAVAGEKFARIQRRNSPNFGKFLTQQVDQIISKQTPNQRQERIALLEDFTEIFQVPGLGELESRSVQDVYNLHKNKNGKIINKRRLRSDIINLVYTKATGLSITQVEEHRKTKAGLETLNNYAYLTSGGIRRTGAPAGQQIVSSTHIISPETYNLRQQPGAGLGSLNVERAKQGLFVPSISPLISGLGDYDGDSYQMLLNSLDDSVRAALTIQGEMRSLRGLGRTHLNEEGQESLATKQEGLRVLMRDIKRKKKKIEESQESAIERTTKFVANFLALPEEISGSLSDGEVISYLTQKFDTSQIDDAADYIKDAQQRISIFSEFDSYQGREEEFITRLAEEPGVGRAEAESEIEGLYNYLEQEGDGDYLQKLTKYYSAVSNTSMAMEGVNSIFKKAGGSILSPTELEATQNLIGMGGTTLIGKAYNTLIPILDQSMMNMGLIDALEQSKDFRSQLEQHDAELYSKLTDDSFMASTRNQFITANNFLGNFQQLVRDALKAKESGGLIKILQQKVYAPPGSDQDPSEGVQLLTLGEAISTLQGTDLTPDELDRERVGLVRKALGHHLGNPIGSDNFLVSGMSVIDDVGITGFGALLAFSDYVKTKNRDLQQFMENWGLEEDYTSKQNRTGSYTSDGTSSTRKQYLNDLFVNLLERTQVTYISQTIPKASRERIVAEARSWRSNLTDDADLSGYRQKWVELIDQADGMDGVDTNDKLLTELQLSFIQSRNREDRALTPNTVDWLRDLYQDANLFKSQADRDFENTFVQANKYGLTALVQLVRKGQISHDKIPFLMANKTHAVNEYLQEFDLDPESYDVSKRELALYLAGLSPKDPRLNKEQHQSLSDFLVNKGGLKILGEYSAGISESTDQLSGVSTVTRATPNVIPEEQAQKLQQLYTEELANREVEQRRVDEIHKHLRSLYDQKASTQAQAQQQFVASRRAETVSAFATPLLLALASQGIPTDERIGMFSFDVLQSMAELAQQPDSQFARLGQPQKGYVGGMMKARLRHSLRTEGVVGGIAHGISQELLYRSINQLAQQGIQTVFKPQQRTTAGRAAVGVGTEILSNIAALSIARTVTKTRGMADGRLSDDAILRVLGDYIDSVAKAVEEAQLALLEPDYQVVNTQTNLNMDYENEATLSGLSWDIETGIIVVDQGGNTLETEFDQGDYQSASFLTSVDELVPSVDKLV